MTEKLIKFLKQKSLYVREETLKLHGLVPETRIASALSTIEIFVALYYGKILRFDAGNPTWESRDRLIVSKGHGAISLYPILADLGFFDKRELDNFGKADSFLKTIPDCFIPGFETINGALGHGLGEACGIAIALRKKNSEGKVFVLCGDGELNEGAVWEAIMLAGQQRLSNLLLIVDSNKLSMLGYCRDIINLEPLDVKLESFGWKVKAVDGHDVEELHTAFRKFKESRTEQPKALIANTVKGKGVRALETDELCHARSLSKDDIATAIRDMRCLKKG